MIISFNKNTFKTYISHIICYFEFYRNGQVDFNRLAGIDSAMLTDIETVTKKILVILEDLREPFAGTVTEYFVIYKYLVVRDFQGQ